MTRPDIDTISMRAEKASPSPWNWETHGGYGLCNLWTPYGVDDKARRLILGTEYGYAREDPDHPKSPRAEDRDFIQHARDDIPALIAYIHELEEAADAVCEAFPEPRSPPPGMRWLNDRLTAYYAVREMINAQGAKP